MMGTEEHPFHSNENKFHWMRFESMRLDTFKNWPSDAPVEARKIAKAGFFHTGDNTKVRCIWCSAELENWNYGDQVMARHRLENPDCPFIRDESDNVPMLPNNSNSENESSNLNNLNNSANQESSQSQGVINHEAGGMDVLDAPPPAGPSRQTSQSTGETGGPQPRPQQPAQFSINDLKREETRLRTFSKWPLTFIHPKKLAKSGFVYTGSRDCVRCVFCGEYVGEWTPNDDPIIEHRSLFPHCPFMQGQEVGNVPCQTSPTSVSQSSAVGQETSNRSRMSYDDANSNDIDPRNSSSPTPAVWERYDPDFPEINPPPSIRSIRERFQLPPTEAASGSDETGIRTRDLNSGPEKGPGVLQWNSNANTGEGSGVIRHSGPKAPKYSTIESRMRTFSDWPPALRQQPKDLAEAGFYYIGKSDQVKCFYCDGGLRNWQPEDDPWTEHSRWFSKCGFVRLVRGDEFIAKTLIEKPPEAMPNIPGSTTSLDVENEVQQQMSCLIVHQALAMGIEASRIKMAIKERLRRGELMFENLDALIDAAFGFHREQEMRHEIESNESPSAFQRSNSATAAIHRIPEDFEMSSTIRETVSNSEETTETEEEMEASTSEGAGADPNRSQQHSDQQQLQDQSEDNSSSKLTHSKSNPTPSASMENLKFSEAMKSQSFAEGSDLEQENRRLKEQRTCKICMDNEIGVVFLPCGHLICCIQCAPALKDCPLCRQPIHGTVKTYMS